MEKRAVAAVSFAKDVVPLFALETDVPHMAKLHVMRVDYSYMSKPEHAQDVVDRLTGAQRPIMPPPPAQPWPEPKIDLFKAWMEGGYKP